MAFTPPENISRSVSLSCSLGYQQDYDFLLDPHHSPLLPTPEVSYITLRSCLVAFKILSKIKEGERLDVTASNVLSKYAKPSWSITRLWQAFWRYWKEQNTENDLGIIETLTENALKCVNNPSSIETAVGYGEKVFFMHKMKKYVLKTLNETFPIYLKTCSSGESNTRTVSAAILENRKKRADEVKGKIHILADAIHKNIGYLESFNVEVDKRRCENYIDIFCKNDPTGTLRRFTQGFSDNVLSSAARVTLTQILGEALVQEIYRQYRLDKVGVFRVQDFQALTIGMLAQYRASDEIGVPKVPSQQIYSNYRKVATAGVTTPLKRYQRVFARDLALLKAHQRLEEYSQGNQWIDDSFRFGYIERDMLDLIAPFTQFPECPMIEGTVYECMENRAYKAYQIFPLRSFNKVYALALVPLEKVTSPILRLLITDRGNPALQLPETNAMLAQLVQRTLEKSLNHLISVEICVSESQIMGQTPVLSCLLQGLKTSPFPCSKVNLYFWRPVEISEEACMQLNALREQMKGTEFILRYFLYKNQLFTRPALPGLKTNRLSNFFISLLYFDRDRDSTDKKGTAFKRYFSVHDEEGRVNETYLCNLITNYGEDQRLSIVVDKHRRGGIQLKNYEEIWQLLNPPPPPPGYLDPVYRGAGSVYSGLSTTYNSITSSFHFN